MSSISDKVTKSELPWPKDVSAAGFKANSNWAVGRDSTMFYKSVFSIRTFVGIGMFACLVLSLFLSRWILLLGVAGMVLPQLAITLARQRKVIDDPWRKAHPVLRGRWAAEIEGDFCVFHIGSCMNADLPTKEYGEIGKAFNNMLAELESNPEEFGYLGSHTYFSGNPRVDTVFSVQYWRSQEQLNAYARNRMGIHFPAMLWTSKLMKVSANIGFWHESFNVRHGYYEAIYVNCPQMLLGKASSVVKAVGSKRTARGRLGKTDGTDLNEHNLPENY
jgi:hypothetical protein